MTLVRSEDSAERAVAISVMWKLRRCNVTAKLQSPKYTKGIELISGINRLGLSPSLFFSGKFQNYREAKQCLRLSTAVVMYTRHFWGKPEEASTLLVINNWSCGGLGTRLGMTWDDTLGSYLVVLEPDPRKIRKEGLVNGAGWKCTQRNVRNLYLWCK